MLHAITAQKPTKQQRQRNQQRIHQHFQNQRSECPMHHGTASLGYEVRVEDATNHGRIDMAVILPENIYLFEFKVVELLPEGKALRQLQDKAYADKYRSRNLPIHLIGVEFSREARNVVGFEVA